MGMVGEACLPSNAYYPRTPDYTLCSGVHVCWSEHSDLSFVYGFMILDYGFGTMTATTSYFNYVFFICFFIKTCVVGTHFNCLDMSNNICIYRLIETFQTRTHNIYIYRFIETFQISTNNICIYRPIEAFQLSTHNICFYKEIRKKKAKKKPKKKT